MIRGNYAFKDRKKPESFIWRALTPKELADEARWYTDYNSGEVDMYFLIYSTSLGGYLLTSFDYILELSKLEGGK